MALENNQVQNLNSDNDEISLKELVLKIKEWVSFLKTKQKTIFIAGFIGALIGLTYAFFEKPTYKALLTFAMEEDKGSGGGKEEALPRKDTEKHEKEARKQKIQKYRQPRRGK